MPAGLLTLVTKPYVHSIRCTPDDAALLDAEAAKPPVNGKRAMVPDVTVELLTFSMIGRLKSTTVRARDMVWPQAMIGFASFCASEQDFFVHEYVVAAEPRLRALFPSLASAEGAATPLIMTAQAGLEDELKMLLRLGADVDQVTDEDGTALFAAAMGGHVGAVGILIDAKANVDKPRPSDGCTPLSAASLFQHVDVISQLLAANVNVDATRVSDGATAVWIASERGHVSAVQVLLNGGANPRIARIDGSTPLQISLERGHHAVADALRAAGSSSSTI
jgi:hypothetical protein